MVNACRDVFSSGYLKYLNVSVHEENTDKLCQALQDCLKYGFLK